MDSLDKKHGINTELWTAKTLSLLSAAAQLYPRPYRWLMETPAPNNVAVRWRLASNTVKQDEEWVEFPPNPESGRLPRNYKSAGILVINKQKYDEIQEQDKNKDAEKHKPAVAYCIGAYIMAAELPDGFGTDPLNKNMYAVALGVGRGALVCSAGTYQADTRTFSPASGAICFPKTKPDIATISSEIPVV